MRIRRFKNKDAVLMLEWMHDKDVVKDLNNDFLSKGIEDCLTFIEKSKTDKRNVHFAIVSDKDEYMGTVSLKNIDGLQKCAEFGIAIRKTAMGKGYSWFGMEKALDYAFKTLRLKNVYWCVSSNNLRACKFYEKHGFSLLKDVPLFAKNKYNNIPNLMWYVVNRNDGYHGNNKKEICGCTMVTIKTIGTLGNGELSFFEGKKDIPFDVKRIYYITNVPEGVRRGFHAHKELKQLLFCPHGRINIVLNDGRNKEEVLLDSPSKGIIIEKPTWREMVWIQSNSVLCVAASDYYSEQDYIRDYDSFLDYIKTNF